MIVATAAVTGGLCQAISFPVNLRQFGNALALFLGVEPADIFLYVFLPPLLFDASVRIDYFVFKKARLPLYAALPARHAARRQLNAAMQA